MRRWCVRYCSGSAIYFSHGEYLRRRERSRYRSICPSSVVHLVNTTVAFDDSLKKARIESFYPEFYLLGILLGALLVLIHYHN
jgi:hypothetical protein